MKVVDRFLQEDMLITRPALYIYIKKEKADNAVNNGITLSDDHISCYLKRLPDTDPYYRQFTQDLVPIRITLLKLKKIKDQEVRLKAVNISSLDNKDISVQHGDNILSDLIQKYQGYLDNCYRDMIPLEKLPRIDLYLSGRFVPGYVCKALQV